MAETLCIDGIMQGALPQVACDAASMTGSAPVMAWLTRQLAGTPYSREAIRSVVPPLPRVLGRQEATIDSTAPGPAPAPVLARLVPASRDVAGADVTLHVYGTNFVPRSPLLFNGGPEITTVVSTTELPTVIAGAPAPPPGT